MKLKDSIYELLENIKADAKNVSEEENLFTSGILDSLGMAMLIPAIEEKFDIEVDVDDIEPENFISVSAICEFLDKYHEGK